MPTPAPTLQTFFFPDPFGTGESVAIQAESQEAALKQLQAQQPQESDAVEAQGASTNE